MALPLPRVVADMEPGGGLVTARKGINALTQSGLQNQIDAAKARYAPLTAQADAASKLAYANLMGPQFLAKLMGNEDFAANVDDPRKANIVNMLLQAGGQQRGNANAFANPANVPNPTEDPFGAMFSKAVNRVSNAFGFGNRQNAPAANAVTQQAPTAQQGTQPVPQQAPIVDQPAASDEVVPVAPTSSYSANAGRAAGLKEEGKEAGKNRAIDLKDLGDTVFNAETKQATLDDINQMIASPAIRELRQIPLAGRHEMAYYAKFGTPAQQQLVGRIYAQMGNIVKDSSRDFAGQFRKGEQQLLQGMKPNDGDTVDTMIGKAESLSVMNKLLMERARLTSNFMNKYHISKLEASELADKQINGNQIRRQVHDQLNPTITIRNRRTGETKTIPISEARSLGVPNV